MLESVQLKMVKWTKVQLCFFANHRPQYTCF